MRAEKSEMSLMRKLSQPEAAAPPWSMATAAITLGVLFLCLILVGPALASILLGSQDATPLLLMLSWSLGLAAAAAFTLVNRRGSAQSWAAMRWRPGSIPLPIAALIGVAIALALDLALSLASGQFLPAPAIFGFQAQGGAGIVLGALLLILLQPLAETLVFQAVLLPRLRWTLGAWRGIIATCLLYALLQMLVVIAPYQATYAALWHGVIHPVGLCLAFSLLKVVSGSSRSVLIARVSGGLIMTLSALALTGV